MNPNKNLAERLLHKYILVIRDRENFAEKITLPFNPARLIVFGFLAAVFFFITGYFIINSLISSGGRAGIDRDKLELMQEDLDMLRDSLRKNENYLYDFRKLLAGEDFPEVESAEDSIKAGVMNPNMDSLKQISDNEQLLREQFEGSGGGENGRSSGPLDLTLFPPIETAGVLRGFIPKDKHFGVDLAVQADEPVRSVAEGTVIISSWTRDTGYVIGVHHGKKLISFYKHNSVLLKQVGERVKAGEIIAQTGNTGEFTDGPHLHLEFWYEGVPINPQDLLSF